MISAASSRGYVTLVNMKENKLLFQIQGRQGQIQYGRMRIRKLAGPTEALKRFWVERESGPCTADESSWSTKNAGSENLKVDL